MARLLGVDRRRYYAWRRRRAAAPSERDRRMAELVEAVKRFHEASGGTYGAPRLVWDLREAGWDVSVKTVAKAMRLAGLEGVSPRTFHPPTTTPGDNPFPVDDLVARRFDMGAKDAAWFSDITYLPTGEGWAYLCVVRDGHTRRVLGRVVADNLRADLVEAALRQAAALRGELRENVIFHADRGCQFTSAQLAEVSRAIGVLRSMGKTGVCWDNAQAESFWSTFKTEFYDRTCSPRWPKPGAAPMCGSTRSTTRADGTPRSGTCPRYSMSNGSSTGPKETKKLSGQRGQPQIDGFGGNFKVHGVIRREPNQPAARRAPALPGAASCDPRNHRGRGRTWPV
jgi:transposase InsO family protein